MMYFQATYQTALNAVPDRPSNHSPLDQILLTTVPLLSTPKNPNNEQPPTYFGAGNKTASAYACPSIPQGLDASIAVMPVAYSVIPQLPELQKGYAPIRGIHDNPFAAPYAAVAKQMEEGIYSANPAPEAKKPTRDLLLGLNLLPYFSLLDIEQGNLYKSAVFSRN